MHKQVDSDVNELRNQSIRMTKHNFVVCRKKKRVSFRLSPHTHAYITCIYNLLYRRGTISAAAAAASAAVAAGTIWRLWLCCVQMI